MFATAATFRQFSTMRNYLPPLAVLAAAIVAANSAYAQRMESSPLVTPFSAAKPGTAPPAGWEPLKFGSLKTPTEFRFIEDQGRTVLHAKAAGAASGLIHGVRFDIKSAPLVQFRWKISNLIEGADNAVAAKEDSPVRITLGFDGDKAKLTLREKTASLIARRATGRDLPYAQLVYVWANTTPVGTVIENPHTRRVEMVVAASGGVDVGKWITVTRNVVEDFRRAFGEEPGMLTAVGILTDTDNTGATVEAWYGDIRFLAAP
jgi:hypothetical protein